MALVSLLLNDGLTKVIPAAEVNTNPNHPTDPVVQMQYNHAAIQVCCLPVCLSYSHARARTVVARCMQLSLSQMLIVLLRKLGVYACRTGSCVPIA